MIDSYIELLAYLALLVGYSCELTFLIFELSQKVLSKGAKREELVGRLAWIGILAVALIVVGYSLMATYKVRKVMDFNVTHAVSPVPSGTHES
ncbi:MAG: hypothetical protein ACSHXW_05920 [Yoonia sp.]